MRHSVVWIVATLALFVSGSAASAQTPENDEGQQAGFHCVEDADAVTLRFGDRVVLNYNKSIQEAPPGIDPIYRRSGYLHPIQTPSGRVVTGDFAADHPHQHGLFFAFVNTTFEGRSVDFWNQRAETGRVMHGRVVSVDSGPDSAGFVVTQLHQDLTGEGGPRTVLRETWTVTAANPSRPADSVAAADGRSFVVDLKTELTCVADSALTVNEYHYGGLAVRGAVDLFRPRAGAAFQKWIKAVEQAPELEPPGIDVMGHEFLTSEGKRRHDGNHTTAEWVDLWGVIDGQPAGIAILSHPDNFRAPQPVRLNPAKPYFCFAPMVSGPFELAPEESLRLRYRLVIHDGEPDSDGIDRELADFQQTSQD